MRLPLTVERLLVSVIDKMFPSCRKGRPRIFETKYIVNRILKVLRTGMQWSELDVIGGTAKTIYNLFNKYSRHCVFKTCYVKLLKLYSFRRRCRFCATDTSFVKSIFGVNQIGPNPTDRGRNASKLSVIVDDTGIPFAVSFHKANQNDCTLLESTFQNILVDLKPNNTIICFYADKGYDSRRCRDFVRSQGYCPKIKKRGQLSSQGENKRRIVENTFSWIDLYRRLIVRYEKYIHTYQEFTFFALTILLGNRMY